MSEEKQSDEFIKEDFITSLKDNNGLMHLFQMGTIPKVLCGKGKESIEFRFSMETLKLYTGIIINNDEMVLDFIDDMTPYGDSAIEGFKLPEVKKHTKAFNSNELCPECAKEFANLIANNIIATISNDLGQTD